MFPPNSGRCKQTTPTPTFLLRCSALAISGVLYGGELARRASQAVAIANRDQQSNQAAGGMPRRAGGVPSLAKLARNEQRFPDRREESFGHPAVPNDDDKKERTAETRRARLMRW